MEAHNPHYEFCSLPCQDVGAWIAGKSGGKIEDTSMLSDIERRGIEDAREGFAAALERHGLLQHMMEMKPEQIDDIIESIVVNFQASVQRAMGRGEVPF